MWKYKSHLKEQKPRSTLRMTPQGRKAFQAYKKNLKQVLDDLPD